MSVREYSSADAGLAPYAAHESGSKGRIHPEDTHTYRGEYQRDRDRIIHSTAFRRLVYKTQVFVNHEGDLYRTRLTHSLEVSQIARTVARSLSLNEQLVEAICLSHDLGHTPFGHAGQDALNHCMREYGGFEHNLQSLRVVDELEEKYADFPGINLTFETREGILKHCSRRNARLLGELGERFLNGEQPGLEAQLANLADAMAYNNHDVDDGLRAGLLTVEGLCSVDLFATQYERVRATWPKLQDRSLIHEVVRGMIDTVVTDMLQTTQVALRDAAPTSIDDVRARDKPLIRFSDAMFAQHGALKVYLRESLYRHEKVAAMTDHAGKVVTTLFEMFFDDVAAMPDEHANRAKRLETELGTLGRARAVADYVAGMTDRYALAAFDRITG